MITYKLLTSDYFQSCPSSPHDEDYEGRIQAHHQEKHWNYQCQHSSSSPSLIEQFRYTYKSIEAQEIHNRPDDLQHSYDWLYDEEQF